MKSDFSNGKTHPLSRNHGKHESDMGRTTEVTLILMVWSKASISLNGSIRKPIKLSSTAADIPDLLQPAKLISFPCDKVN